MITLGSTNTGVREIINITLKILIVIFYMTIILIGYIQNDAVSEICIRKVTICFFIWLLLSVAFRNYPSISKFSIIFIFAIWGGYESLLGIYQIINNFNSSRWGDFVITGSFLNPGPYGGFLATIVCVLFPSVLNNTKNNTFYCIVYKALLFFVIIVSIMVLSFTKSRASYLSLICSILFYLFASINYKFIPKRYYLIFSPILLSVCIWGYVAKKTSADGRLFMNKICINAILNNKAGYGLGKFSIAYENAQLNYFKKKDVTIENGILSTGMSKERERHMACDPEYAFNMILQIGVELGPIIMSVFSIILILAAIILYGNKSSFFYGFLSTTIFGFFSYSLCVWQFQIMSSIFLSAIFYSTISNKRPKQFLFYMTISIPILFINFKNAITTSHDYYEWKKNKYLYGIKKYDLYADYCSEKKTLNYINEFLLEYGYSLSKMGLIDESDSILNLCQTFYMTPRLLLISGDNCIQRKDYYNAEQHYKNAFIMLPDRILPLKKLAYLYMESGNISSLINVINSIKRYRFKVENEETQKIRNDILKFEDGLFNTKSENY